MSRPYWSRADWMRACRQHPGLNTREMAAVTGRTVRAVIDARAALNLPIRDPETHRIQDHEHVRLRALHLVREGYGWEDLCAKLPLTADEARSLARLSPQTRAA